MIPPALFRRIRVYALVLGLTLALLVAVLAAGGGEGGSRTAPRAAAGILFTDVHPFGANFFLEREPESWKREKTAQMAADAGLRWARQQIPWSDVQPVENGPMDWAKYDAIVDTLRAHGMDVILRLDWGPRWARADYVPEVNNPPDPDHLADYAAFVAEAAKRYAGKVRIYQVWNEPNLRTEWGNRPADAAGYAHLLHSAAASIRAADPNAVVMAAPLAITTEDLEVSGNMSDIAFLEALYSEGAEKDFDVMGANAFGMNRAPSDAPGADRLNMRRIELQRAVMERHGDSATPIWLSEYGWNASPDEIPPDRLVWDRVDEQKQADYTVAGVDWAREHWPWAGVFGIWYFQYHRLAPDRPESYFRMVDLDFTPRRLYAAVRDATAQLELAGPGLWQEKSSPVRSDAGWAWQYADGALDGNAVVAQRPDAKISMRFDGTSVEVRSRQATGRASEGPTDDLVWVVDGRATEPHPTVATPATSVDPHQDGWTWWTSDGLQPGTHVLELNSEVGAVAVDALRVGGGEGANGPDAVIAGLVVLALVVAVLLARDLIDAARRFP